MILNNDRMIRSPLVTVLCLEGLDMRKLWIYIAGSVVGIAVIIWMLVLIFVNNAEESKQQNQTMAQNLLNAQNMDILHNANIAQADKNNGQRTANSDNMEQNAMDKNSYYLRFENDKVVIYREPNREFYDYADIKMDLLPPEIKEQIKLGMYIDGEERLYDFLQTYSS